MCAFRSSSPNGPSSHDTGISILYRYVIPCPGDPLTRKPRPLPQLEGLDQPLYTHKYPSFERFVVEAMRKSLSGDAKGANRVF